MFETFVPIIVVAIVLIFFHFFRKSLMSSFEKGAIMVVEVNSRAIINRKIFTFAPYREEDRVVILAPWLDKRRMTASVTLGNVKKQTGPIVEIALWGDWKTVDGSTITGKAYFAGPGRGFLEQEFKIGDELPISQVPNTDLQADTAYAKIVCITTQHR